MPDPGDAHRQALGVQPTVYRVVHQRLALSLIRLALAALGFAGSIVAGADGAAAGVGLAVGAGISGLALVTDRRWLLLGSAKAEPLPGAVRPAPLARAVRAGLLPSTVGVAVLTAVALAFQPILAAVLAGILAGMGIVSLVSTLEIALWERRSATTLHADADVHTRRYVAPAPSSAPTAADSPGK